MAILLSLFPNFEITGRAIPPLPSTGVRKLAVGDWVDYMAGGPPPTHTPLHGKEPCKQPGAVDMSPGASKSDS